MASSLLHSLVFPLTVALGTLSGLAVGLGTNILRWIAGSHNVPRRIEPEKTERISRVRTLLLLAALLPALPDCAPEVLEVRSWSWRRTTEGIWVSVEVEGVHPPVEVVPSIMHQAKALGYPDCLTPLPSALDAGSGTAPPHAPPGEKPTGEGSVRVAAALRCGGAS